MSLITTALGVPKPEIPAPATKEVSLEKPNCRTNPMEWFGLEASEALETMATRRVDNRRQDVASNRNTVPTLAQQELPKNLAISKARVSLNSGSEQVVVNVLEGTKNSDTSVQMLAGNRENREKGEYGGVYQKLPGLDELIKRVRESRYICTVFILVLICTCVFAVVLLVDPDPELSDVFAGLFGVFALLQVILGALLQVRSNNIKDIVPCFEVVTKDNNGVRAFMVLEALVDIAVGALSLAKPVVVPVASAAIAMACVAISILIFVPLCHRDEDSKERFIYGYHMPLAIVLTDSADVLLLLRVVMLKSIQAKDILLFVFLVLNVVVTELSTLIAIRAEETTEAPAKENPEERKARLEKAIKMRNAMRNKSLAQTVVTGTLIIPMMLAIILSDFLDSKVEVALILLPVVSFVFRVSESELFRGRWLFKTRLNDSWRDLLPRIYVLTCALVLAANDAALSLNHEVQQIVFYAYAIYNGVPFMLRVVEDWTQHQVNIIPTRPGGVSDRETDKHRPKVFRSALADYVDRSRQIYQIEEIRAAGKWNPSVAFACYCKYDTKEGQARDVERMKACLLVELDKKTKEFMEEKHDVDTVVEGQRVHIACLNWSGLKINDASVLTEVINLACLHQVLDLVLGSNEIGDDGAAALGTALAKAKTLIGLHLYSNNIGPVGAQHLAQALQVNTTLHKLDLWSNKIGDDGANALGNGLKRNESLRTLYLQNNQIGYDGAQALGRALERNNSLEHLSLNGNFIKGAGSEAIGRALAENNALTTLDLEENQIGDKGAAAIGECLKSNKALQTLNLRWNKIHVKGAKALGDGLKKNMTLTELNLNANIIGDRGVKRLADMLKINKSLKILRLRRNEIGNEGAEALRDGLKENKFLAELDLEYNGIDPAWEKCCSREL